MTISHVTKSSGEVETYQADKVRTALRRAGADETMVNETVNFVEQSLPAQTSTDQVFACSLKRLKDLDTRVAARFSLKRAIANLGPAGYNFERFIGAILREHGYTTEVGTMVRGLCIEHEVDVLAEKDNQRILIECKYHHEPGSRSDLHVAMYTSARFEDVVAGAQAFADQTPIIHEAWLVTNTKCTDQAIKFARCKNLQILGWRYPHDGGLEKLIESKGMYPITVLPSLSREALAVFSRNDVMLSRDICHRQPAEIAATYQLPLEEMEILHAEAKLLC